MKKLFLLMLLPLAMSVVSCGSDDDPIENEESITPNRPKEVSVTSSADVQSFHRVVLKGYANGATGKVGFCYSSTNSDPNPNTCLCVETTTIMSDNSYEITIDNLEPKTKYYYRAFATKNQILVLAKDVKTFTTDEVKGEAIDLGLSVKWATCNVGTTVPEGYGDFFAWGETEPHYAEGHSQDDPCKVWRKGKEGYTFVYYKWCTPTSSLATKYNNGTSGPGIDNKTVLEASDDAATVNWGRPWRMPTLDEFEELIDKCTWKWTSLNGVWGSEVVGPNGKSIFLPAAGNRHYDRYSEDGEYGLYWSSSLSQVSDQNALYLRFYYYVNSVSHRSMTIFRYTGCTVRPVCE